MTEFLSKYLTPSQISKLYCVVALIGLIGLGVFLAEVTLPEKKERVEETDVTNIITATKSRDLGLDAISDKVKIMERGLNELEEHSQRLTEQNKKLEDESKSSITLAKELKQTRKELARLKSEADQKSQNFDERVNKQVAQALKEHQVKGILNVDSSNTQSSGINPSQPMGRPEFNPSATNSFPNK